MTWEPELDELRRREALAEQLDDTKLVAAVEIASQGKGPAGHGDHDSTGQ